MKLIRFGEPGNEHPGVIDKNGSRLDISKFGEDYDMLFFENAGLNRLAKWLEKNKESCPEISPEERLGPPVRNPSKIVCVGLNYAQHAKESGMKVPEEPVLFFKATTALCGPNDDLIIPKRGQKTDWEVELAVVVGKRTSYISEQNALSHVAGYVLHNDYSERAFQLEQSGQWVKGKSCDTFAPLGPFLATQNEIPDPQTLDIGLTVNGKQRQKSNTNQMVFGVAELIAFLSRTITLMPGDLIATGTPPGVALGMKPPIWLEDGDVVETTIEKIGSIRNTMRAL